MLLINLAATLVLTGVVWVLQVVQLPLLAETENVDIVAHRRRNTILMTPLMVIEGITAVLLYATALSALILLAIIWAVTFFKIIPLFRKGAIRDLILWNWMRTGCWTVRCIIMLWIVADRAGI